MKRCSMLKLCVTEPVLIRVTRLTRQALLTVTLNRWPSVSLVGAVRIRSAGAQGARGVYR